MHILIATTEYPPHSGGGLLKFYSLLAPALAAAGCRVTVLVANPLVAAFPEYEADGVVVRAVPDSEIQDAAERLPHFAAAPMLRRWLGAAAALADAAREEAADVIEATDFGLSFLPFAAGEDASRLVVQLHGSLGQIATHETTAPRDELDAALAQLAEAAALPRARALHAYSPRNAAEWSSRLGRPVEFIPPPFPLGSQRDVPTATTGPVLVVGRVQQWKGPHILCESIRELTRRHFDIPVQWVGRDTDTGPNGTSMSAYLSLAYPDVWGSRIAVLDQQPFSVVAGLQAAARVVLIPSQWDTFNFTLVEAMGAGKVVICSKGAGGSWLIEHGVNGFLIEAGAAGDLTAVLEHVHALTGAELDHIGARARATVATELSLARTIPPRLERYAEIARGASTAAPSDWLTALFTPSSDRTAGLDYLDGVALRRVAGYVARRLHHKLIGGVENRVENRS